MVKQVAAARIDQPRAVEERLSRKRGHVLALPTVGQVALKVAVEGVRTEVGRRSGQREEGEPRERWRLRRRSGWFGRSLAGTGVRLQEIL